MKMQWCATFLVFLVYCSPSYSMSPQEKMRFCQGWADFSRGMMYGRQTGVPIATAIDSVLETAKETKTTEVELELALSIIDRAYSSDLAATDRGIEVEVIQFSEAFFEDCMASEQ